MSEKITGYFGLYLLGFLSTIPLFIISPVLPQIIEQYGVSYVEVGYFLTVYSLAWSILGLYSGHLSDRYGKKRLATIGLLTYSASAFLLGIAKTFHQLIIFRLIQGVGLGMFGPACLGLTAQFDMNIRFTPARSTGAWQIGTITMLSSAPIEGATQITLEAGMEKIRSKSLKITFHIIFLVDELLSREPYNFSVGTTQNPKRRGGHVAVGHPTEAFRINEALKARGVLPDFRPPNVIRLAPIPLYTSYSDVWRVAQHMKTIIDNKEYERFSKERGVVT